MRSRGAKAWLALKIAGGGVLGLGASVALLLHMDLAATRRLVARTTNHLLLPVFQGRLTIEALGRLGLDGVDGARVRIDDPSGRPVLVADGVRAHIHLWKLLRTVASSSGAIEIDIPEASVESADLRFDTDPSGVPVIQQALTPQAVLRAPGPTGPPGRTVRVVIGRATVRHAWVHGEPTWAPPVDLEVQDVLARVVVTPGSLEVNAERASVVARALPVARGGAGTLRGRVLVPSEHGNPFGVTATFAGSLGSIQERAHFSIDGDVVDASLDLDEVAPEKVRALLPDYPVQDLLTAHVDARGSLPELDVVARAQLRGGGVFASSGHVVLSGEKRASLHASIAALDLRGLAPGMPVSSLSAGIDATLALGPDQRLTGAATIVSQGGTIGGQVLPAAEARATFASGGPEDRLRGRVDASVTVRDRGLTGDANLHLSPKGRSFQLGFDARAHAQRLDGIARLPLPVRGTAEASARGAVALDTFTVDVDVDARARGVAQGESVAVETLAASAHVTGSVFAPRVDANVVGDGVDLAGVHADRVTLHAIGLATAPHVHATLLGGDAPEIHADADVQLGRATVLRDVRAVLSRAGDRAEISLGTVRLNHGRADADGITIDGLGGQVRGDLGFESGAFAVRASGRDVDLGRAARLAGASAWCTGGELTFDVDAKVRGATAEGRATLDVANASVLRLRDASAHVELTLSDRELTASALAKLGDFGTVELKGTHVHLAKAGAASVRSWQRLWGAVELRAKLDLARLDPLFPEGSLPVRLAAGQLDVTGRLKRDSMSDDTPHLALTATTSGLVVEDRGAPKGQVRGAPSFRIDGVDLGVDARIDGESGFAEIAARAFDKAGPLVSIDAKSTAMPYSAILMHPGQALDLVSAVAFDATLSVPERDLGHFPAAIALGGAGGALSVDATLKGTLAAPSVDLHATLRQGVSTEAALAFPVDLELTSHYAAGHTDATVRAETKRLGRVLEAEVHADGQIQDLVAGRAGAPWQASGRAHLAGFPLSGVGFFEDRQVRGLLTGDVTLEGLHRDAKATVDLAATGLQIGDVSYKDARVHATVDGRTVDATCRLDHGDGSAEAHASGGASWGAALSPSLAQPVDLSVSAVRFRAETLLPFAHDALAELEGRIDGKAHVAYDLRQGKAQLDGKIVFSQGKLELSSALGELHDATATLVLTPDGLVRLVDVSALGVTGKVQASATARLSAAKDGLALGGARAHVQIAKGDPFPVTIEGSSLGSISGALDVTETPTRDGRGVAIAVEIPTLHVVLPDSGSRNLQSLDELADAEIGVRHGAGELVLVPIGPAPETKARATDARRIEITTHLGADVDVKRGVDLKVGLEGQPVVTISDKLHVTGQIRLRKGGLLDVQGKAFEIEKGTVSFIGEDPENPQVVVTASWNAPDGTRIYADYIGPLKTGKVTLRSEPPLAQTDIVALLLFGTAEGQSGSGGQANATTGAAVGAAGGVAAQPINHALDQFGVHALAARVDTSQATNPKPEVEVQIAKDISVQIAQVIGTPPPGSNPDTTLLTLNWRLLRGLSVATTVGNLGSSIVDMVWERRY